MARFLYAACGEGYGHATRAHSVGTGLMARGHEVQFLSSLKGGAYLREVFPDHFHEVFGLRVAFRDGQIRVMRTLAHNISNSFNLLRPSNAVIKRALCHYRPDLVISDFEPFTAFWSQWEGVPYISLDNVHVLTHCALDRPPGFLGDFLSTYAAIRLHCAGAKRYLVSTFFKVPIRYHPTTLVPPILRPDVYTIEPSDGDFLLAYKSGFGQHDDLRKALESYDRLPIRAYGFDHEGHHGHVTYRRVHPQTFLEDLASCVGVIGTAGHSLICECLHFGKPMLLLPLHGQYEQVINAHYVQKLGFGRSVPRLDSTTIHEFVNGLDAYRCALTGTDKTQTIDTVLDTIEKEVP
jgi:uncharacterized protein (TIGR00661 family)